MPRGAWLQGQTAPCHWLDLSRCDRPANQHAPVRGGRGSAGPAATVTQSDWPIRARQCTGSTNQHAPLVPAGQSEGAFHGDGTCATPGSPRDPLGHPRPMERPQGSSGSPPRPKGVPGKRSRIPPKGHPGCPQHPKSSGEHRGTPLNPPQLSQGQQNLENGQGGTWRIPGKGFKFLFGGCTQIPTGVGGPSTISHRHWVGAFTDFNLVLLLETKKKNNPKKE